MKKERKRWAYYAGWGIFVTGLGLLFLLSSSQWFTGEHTKLVVQRVLGLSDHEAYVWNGWLRKLGHVLAYGILAVFFDIFLKRRSVVYAWLCTCLVASVDEIHQMYIPNRTPMIQDVLLDCAAAFVFLCCARMLWSRRRSGGEGAR